MKILITGGSGLVGCAIKEISNNYDHEFIFSNSKECNLLDYEKTLNYVKKMKPDVIIHLAAMVGGLYKNMNFPVEMYENNIAPVIDFYKQSKLLTIVNGEKSVNEINIEISDLIEGIKG